MWNIHSDMRKIWIGIGCILLMAISVACNNDKRNAEKIVATWVGKQIRFPEKIECLSLDKETICPQPENTPYKVLIYTDSIGCFSCKLKLPIWKQFIQDANSEMAGKVEFLFYFHQKDKREIKYLLDLNDFKYPVFCDETNKINQLNNFPKEMEYQCFLLNKDNEVLLIGNPTLNPTIWELYKQKIIGNEKTATDQLTTSVSVDNEEIEIKDLKTGEKSIAQFILKNTGENPLLIKHVETSCGCTDASWEKKPILPKEETIIHVEVKPDNPGYFHKKIQVYSNTDNLISLVIKGHAQ